MMSAAQRVVSPLLSPRLALLLHHINQGVIHAYLFLLLFSCSVHPFCLPPLPFIRTVDGESRTDPIYPETQVLTRAQSVAICGGKQRRMCSVYRLSRSRSPRRAWRVLLCEETERPDWPDDVLKILHRGGQRSGQGRGSRSASRAGPLERIF